MIKTTVGGIGGGKEQQNLRKVWIIHRNTFFRLMRKRFSWMAPLRAHTGDKDFLS